MLTWIVERRGFLKGKRLRKPVLIVGLPGVGMVGRVTAKYLIDKLEGERFADLFSHHFPPQAFMLPSGKLKLFRNSFYLVRTKARDLIILTGDVQPIDHQGHYEVAVKVLDYVEKLKVREVIAVGGYLTGKLENDPTLYGVVNSLKLKDRLKKWLTFGKAKGTIVGLAGLIPALAKHRLKGMDGITVLAQTHGGFVDTAASGRVLRFLSEYLGFDIDLSDLEEQARKTEEIIKKVEEEIQKQKEMAGKDLSYIR